MSAPKPPILMPGSGPRRVYRRRRRRRFAAAGAGALLALALGASLAAGLGAKLVGGQGDNGHAAYVASAVNGRGLSAAALEAQAAQDQDHGAAGSQRLSPIGLPLDRPALELQGVDGDDEHPVHVSFRPAPRAGLLFDLDSGRVLWSLHPHERAPIASLTKMMTALLVAQSTRPGAHVMVTREASHAPGSRVGVLPVGRRVAVEPLMYGLLLPSGNDAAVALAEHVAGTVRHFVREMNVEAALLGLGCTQYSTPSGYVDSENFSCAVDLAELARIDLEQPRIARIAHHANAVLPFPIKGGKLFLYNNNPLVVYGYPGADGLKTGYTEAAGKCLVATAERDGVRLGVVLLDAPAPGTEAQRLLDEGFEQVYHLPPEHEPPIPGGV
jgi:serine-type D-Ala-D-Ala carboxypeptidase (penicillin-binding protein 5/6)